ncbi:MAG: PQQ-dependent sugar dehydrogenase [Nocardioidaceae bacterium]
MILTLACTAKSGPAPPEESVTADAVAPKPSAEVAKTLPRLSTKVVMGKLDIPWDVAVMPSGAWLVTERDRQRITFRLPHGGRHVLADSPPGFWSAGETGLMSIVADPQVGRNDRFYTCSGFDGQGAPEIRVIAWRLNQQRTQATRVEPLLFGIDISSGRHGGCRIRFDPRGAMYVGTGDSTVGTNPQDLGSLNGKVLRLKRFSGEPWPSNPWPHARDPQRRYVYTYGHRNVQGLAFRPGDRMWSVEHGTDRDDEVNRLVAGGNYGWNPVPGYNESAPMTDFSLPGRQQAGKWRSGYPTIATSGATWVRGRQWGGYRGTLAVAALGAEKLLFMRFDTDNSLQWVRVPPAMNGDFGRLRSVVQSTSGALLVTTSNGGGTDKVVRITPR